MQNRYSGDIGDFSKLGLLRALAAGGLSVGVNWYLVPDERHNNDGRHVDYLDREAFRACDEALWRELGRIVRGGERSVRALMSPAILAATHYARVLDFAGRTRDEREELRRAWHEDALRALEGVDIVCADPDNGLIVPSAMGTTRENKYILPGEIRDYYRQGASVIYYQHKGRRADGFYEAQHRRLLSEAVPEGAEGLLLKFIPTSQRYYGFVIHPEHAAAIRGAVDGMLATAWGRCFQRL